VWDDRFYFDLLTETLQVNTTLISLNVSSNFLDDSHLRKLAKALTINSTLQELNMGGNSFHSWEGIDSLFGTNAVYEWSAMLAHDQSETD
jgi:hypothetical protein